MSIGCVLLDVCNPSHHQTNVLSCGMPLLPAEVHVVIPQPLALPLPLPLSPLPIPKDYSIWMQLQRSY